MQKNFFGLLCLYKLILDTCFVFYLKETWHMSNIVHNTVDSILLMYTFSWLSFSIVCGLFTLFVFDKDRIKKSISQQILVLLLLISVIPVMSLFGGGGMSYHVFFYYVVFFLWLLICYVIINGITWTADYITASGRLKEKLFIGIGIGTIIAIVWTFSYYLQGSFFFGGLDVYDQRAIFADIQKTMPGILVYVLSMANIVEIFLLLYCINCKKYKYMPLLLIVWYMHFSLAGEKTVLFSVLVAVITSFMAKKITLTRIVYLGIFSLSVLSLSSVAQSLCKTIPLWGIELLRRALFFPAVLQEYYVEFISRRSPSYWGINPEYSIGQGLDNIISDLYFDSSLGFANNGLLGDCFANMGEYGIVLYPMVLALILLSFDLVVSGKDARLFLGVIILFVTYLVNGMLTTVMVSHGGLMMLLLLWLFPEKNVQMNDKEI